MICCSQNRVTIIYFGCEWMPSIHRFSVQIKHSDVALIPRASGSCWPQAECVTMCSHCLHLCLCMPMTYLCLVLGILGTLNVSSHLMITIYVGSVTILSPFINTQTKTQVLELKGLWQRWYLNPGLIPTSMFLTMYAIHLSLDILSLEHLSLSILV